MLGYLLGSNWGINTVTEIQTKTPFDVQSHLPMCIKIDADRLLEPCTRISFLSPIISQMALDFNAKTKEEKDMKEAYIQKIIEQMNRCNDITLLDLILKLLVKTNTSV